MPPNHGRLAVFPVLWGALSFPWNYRAALKAISAPLLAVIAVSLAWEFIQPEEQGAALWVLYFLDAIATSWLAITVHRLVLVGTTSPRGFDSMSLRRLGIFAGLLAGGWLLFAALAKLLEVMAMDTASEIFVDADGSVLQMYALAGMGLLALLLALWVFSRFSLLFPSIAIDRGFDPVAAWNLSRGNSLRLMVIVGVFPFLLAAPVLVVYREDAAVLELIARDLLTALLLIVEVAALSLAYWQLTASAPPPTDPPG
jgi:hypothetical protein